MAPAVEDTPWFDDQAGCVNLSGHHPLRLDLNAALRENHPIESSRDDHVVPLNLTLDFGRLAQNQTVFREDISLYLAINTERAS